MNGHMRTFTIDGLRLGEKQFNWNDKLIIFHNKDTDENIANIHIVIPESYKINSFEDGFYLPIFGKHSTYHIVEDVAFNERNSQGLSINTISVEALS